MPDSLIDLVSTVLLVSAALGGDGDEEMFRAKLSGISDRIRLLLKLEDIDDAASDPKIAIEVINRVLFREEGFHGNDDNYYEVENSLLETVMSRHTGIPITLSIVYMAVAAEIGLPLKGIGLPGHFLVGYWTDESEMPDMIIDPFFGGKLLSIGECAARVNAIYDGEVGFSTEWLLPVTNRQILARVLNNIKGLLVAEGSHRKALQALDMLIAVQPNAVWELRERGLLYYRTGAFTLALADLRRYLRSAPESDETDLVKYYVQLLRRLVSSTN